MCSHRFMIKTESRCFRRLSMGSCDLLFVLGLEMMNSPSSAFKRATSLLAFSIETLKRDWEEDQAMQKK